MKIINGIGARQEQEDWEQQLIQKVNRWLNQTTFAEKDLKELIARVDFIDDKRLQVRWKFMDYEANILDKYTCI